MDRYNHRSEESSAGAADLFPFASVPGLDDDDLQSYAQQHPVAPPRSDMPNLDLNNQGASYPDLSSYTGLLQSGDSNTGRSARRLFQPPRPSIGGAASGDGGLQLGRGFEGSPAGRGGGGQQQLHRVQGNPLLPPARGRGRGRVPPAVNTGRGPQGSTQARARGTRTRRAPARA